MTPEMVTAIGGTLLAVLATVGGAVKWVDWRIRQRESDRDAKRAKRAAEAAADAERRDKQLLEMAEAIAATRWQVENDHGNQPNLREDLDRNSGQISGLATQVEQLIAMVDRLADVPAALDRLTKTVDRDRKAIRSEVDTVRTDVDRLSTHADSEHGRLWRAVDEFKRWFTAADDSE